MKSRMGQLIALQPGGLSHLSYSFLLKSSGEKRGEEEGERRYTGCGGGRYTHIYKYPSKMTGQMGQRLLALQPGGETLSHVMGQLLT
jgi:hypothetical protein